MSIMKNTIVGVAVFSALPLFAKIDMGTPFTNGVVLQRERDVPIWGKADPLKKVTVSFAGANVSTTADKEGCWLVKLPSMVASKESRTMTISEAGGDTVEVKDVLVGEVWMCSGQSNTDCPIWGEQPRYRDGWGAMTLMSVRKPFVRIVKTVRNGATEPNRSYKATWMPMMPSLYDVFKRGQKMPSAMGYYYALELANALDIPIGLVDSSVGGTNIDAWTPPSGYANHPALADVAQLPCLDANAFEEAKKNGVYKGKNIYGKSWIQQPSALWNGMVAAYAPMAIRGFIWYQGCHNSSEPQRYTEKMHALYDGWSTEFKNPDLKLYFVQLTPWGNPCIYRMQLAQQKFADEEKNAAIAVINDVGNNHDIHPNDKRTVAKRLSLHALKRDYGWSEICDNSPTVKDAKVVGDAFVLSFNDCEGLYVYNPDHSLQCGLEIAGADGVWHPAKIRHFVPTKGKKGLVSYKGNVAGKTLEVASDKVKEPKSIRYLATSPWIGAIYSDKALPLGAFEIVK